MSNTRIKTGSYAVTTVYKMPWVKKKTPVVKTRKKRAEKKIIHSIFQKCSKLTEDKYWISIFNDCSRGKFPRGFLYKNGMLSSRKGNKNSRVLIPESGPEAFSICVSFFKSSGGLMSGTDRKRLQEEEEEKLLGEKNIRNMMWKDIKTQKIKDLLISEFISSIAKSGHFDKNQKKELSTTIKKGFMLKYFKSNNITMEQGKITSIKGLIYNKKDEEYIIDPKLTAKRHTKKIKGLGIERIETKPRVSFIDMWGKYLDGLEKEKSSKSNNFTVIESKSDSNSFSGEYHLTNSTSGTTGSI